MEFTGRTELRATFDAVAEEYDRSRPQYPAEVFDQLTNLCDLRHGAKVLEIGCGTGQATLPLAERGLAVLAVELGTELAEMTRARAARFPYVNVVTASFEEWEMASPERFDAVVSFAAFHWVDPQVRYVKAARLLKPGGKLAVFDWQDSDCGDDFFRTVEADYAAVVPEWQIAPPPIPTVEADWFTRDIAASDFFGPFVERRFVWVLPYSADAYVSFLNTRSSYRALEDTQRMALFDRIRRRIESRPGKVIRREFLGVLAVAPVTNR